MLIRCYRPGDEALLVDVWNQTLPQDGITLKRFTQKVLLDPNFRPQGLWVAEHDGELVGWILAVIDHQDTSHQSDDQGWITTFGVAPPYQKLGIAHQLWEHAEQYFLSHHRHKVMFAAYAPNYFLPGLDANRYPRAYDWLLHHGFSVLYSPVAMDKNLVDFCVPEDVRLKQQELEQQGCVVHPLKSSQIWPLLSFLHQEFDRDWERAVRTALLGSLSLSQIWVVAQDDQIVGFAMYGGYEDIAERFGPFGVAKALRGHYLGKVLLYRTLEAMQRQGLHSAWFLWTGEREPAGHLYLRTGFAVTRRFHVMVKTLSPKRTP
ncbi:Acetyltransferase (GNAT) domain-containing protein [Sulfobacillus thermosulfidooxidans DSM 9293]|uniref:Acetyltransferase (GNAT) domain-containing protein n=1 Tax=Sulfobacillus thermosulfidooxidans (strain DSM 9293 / VKM B-1269 / AT-1) TaxID=929705 RepID=A0A1W1WE03_SULTA|nr:GNAT family N-acetyltransferase [Sulfobacillus thermosulfidooxidans]SMC04455.1 Acetyltransferase (GNAT) domain-containing protein [Sulfobacillus thermosulfidooxidans DSM 9293]